MRPKTRNVALGIGLTLGALTFAGHAEAQFPGLRKKAAPTPAPVAAPAPAESKPAPTDPAVKTTSTTSISTGGIQSIDPTVRPASAGLPDLTPADQLKPATINVPDIPIEPFLLTKDNGPFMVMARTFRGPDAEKFALALTLELRNVYGLPAYILRTKDFPQRSMVRGVPPMAEEEIRRPDLTNPEKVRTYDEAAVLVGNEKTLKDSEKLLNKVRSIKPECLNEIPTVFGWRQGLKSALRTTNPYIPAQNLFPGRKKDTLVTQMNGGPRSIFNCPGRYTLQVAEFSGRSIYNPGQKDTRLFDNDWLRKSPLATAADDAERLAEAMARDPEIQKSGFQPYVYHDRTSSRVLIGSFNSPADPKASQLRDTMLKLAVPIAERSKGSIIAPANALTDLEDPNNPIKSQ